MDEIDHGIIKLLGVDGRKTNKFVARALGVAESTVATRIRALQADTLSGSSPSAEPRLIPGESFSRGS